MVLEAQAVPDSPAATGEVPEAGAEDPDGAPPARAGAGAGAASVEPRISEAGVVGREPASSSVTGARRARSRPTIKDVAALAGVSHSAASRALNGTGYVGERSRERVLEVAAELGYVPHVTARYLKERVTRAVGVLVDDLRRPTDAALAAGVLAAARERGLATMLADRVAGPEPVRNGLLDFVAFGVAGVVLVPGPGGSTEYLARYGIPTIEVVADGDAAAAGRDAVERLAQLLEVGRASRTR